MRAYSPEYGKDETVRKIGKDFQKHILSIYKIYEAAGVDLRDVEMVMVKEVMYQTVMYRLKKEED